MRRWDRQVHDDSYPSLLYPELYLLSGGYSAFHRDFGNICRPADSYTPMSDSQHREKLHYFRANSHCVSRKHAYVTPHPVSMRT